jgi:hypothetical protein
MSRCHSFLYEIDIRRYSTYRCNQLTFRLEKSCNMKEMSLKYIKTYPIG